MPISFRGHRVKCDASVGEVIANESIAAVQNKSSKYFEK
jgi:hypothetical protein